MLKPLRISGVHKKCHEIYFTFIPLSEPPIPMFLKTFLSMLFSLIGIQCVNQKGLDNHERSLVKA